MFDEIFGPTRAHAHATHVKTRSDEVWGPEVQRILCVRLDNMGDVLMCTPAMASLKQTFAGRSITLLTSSASKALAALVPVIDEVMAFDAPWVKHPHLDDEALRMQQHHLTVKLIKDQAFDAAVIFTSYSQSPLAAAMMMLDAAIPRRLAHCRENPYQLLTTWVPETEPQQGWRHEARRQLDLVAATGAGSADLPLQLRVSEAARLELRRNMPRRERPVVVVHCGSTAESRRYSATAFGKAIAELQDAIDCTVYLTGRKTERAVVDVAEQAARSAGAGSVVNLAGDLCLEVFAALIEDADLLISNNSGPVHMASALGTAVVDLYALTNPQHTPWMTPHRVLSVDVECRWCYRSVCPEIHHRCLKDIEPARVVAAALELLQGATAPLAEEKPIAAQLAGAL